MASFSSENDPAQVLKNLLRIGVPSQSDSTDASEPSISSSVMQAIENLRLNSDALERRSSASSTSDTMKMETLGQQRTEQQIVTLKLSAWHQLIQERCVKSEGDCPEMSSVLLGDDQNCVHPIYGQHVEIVASKSSGSTQTTPTSARVAVNSVVKYDWEHRCYLGNLVAVHQSEVFVAFAIKGKTNGVVRVFNCRTAERILLKGFSGPVADIDFARSVEVLLGCIDQKGDLHVFKILTSSNGKLSSDILLNLTQPGTVPSGAIPSGSCHRIIWCPFVPDKKDDDDCDDVSSAKMAETMLAVSSENIVRVLNVEAVSSKHGREPVDFNQLTSGCCMIDGHLQRVVDMALVPDGSTLATASSDGMVRCFELDLSDPEPPRCIFKWKPHNGRPVSSIFFLDDLKNTSPDAQFWKFAVTGADENRELKVWSCETWSCLQTLTLSPSPNVPLNFQVMPCIKAGLDASATYMVLSDIKRKVLYVLHISKDNSQDVASFSSVSEFLPAQPCLSLAIHNVTKKLTSPLRELTDEGATSAARSASCNLESEMDELLSLYIIQTKAVEHLRLRLQPSSSDDLTVQSPFSPGSDSGHLKDRLSDVSNFSDSESASQTLTKRTNPQDSVQSLEIIPSDTSSFTHVTSMDEEERMTLLPGGDLRPFQKHQPFPLMPLTSANEAVAKDLGHVSTSRELSQALAHISSIQLPVHGPLEAEAPPGFDRRLTASLMSSGALSSASGARPKEGTSPQIGDEAEEGDARFLSASKDSAADTLPRSSWTSVTVGSSSTLAEWKQNGAPCSSASMEAERSRYDRKRKDFQEEEGIMPEEEGVFGRGGDKEENQHKFSDSPLQERCSRTSSKSSLPLICSTQRSNNGASVVSPEGNGIQELQSHLREISVLLREQHEAMQLLRSDLCHQKSDPTSVIDNLQSKVNNLEMQCVSTIKETVDQFARGSDGVLQKVVKDLDVGEQQRLQQQLASLSQVVHNTLQSQLELSIHREMQQSVLPGISRIFSPVTKRLSAELSQKLTATDALLKESIAQIVKSKTVTETIGKVAANSLETVLYATCRDQLIPSFDRGCQNILSQVDETFQKGIRMYMHQMQKRMDKLRKQPNDVVYSPVVHQIQGLIAALAQAKDSRDPLRRQLTELIGSVQHYTEQLEKQKTNLATTLNDAINSLPMQLADSMREMIHNEVSLALKEHQMTVSEKIASTFQSRSATPAPQATSLIQSQRMQITALVQRNQINAAFQLALSLMDLGMLMFVCEMVSPADVFSQTPCLLDQPVLLSLIQQLSADLRSQTQLKYRYLEDALLNIDQTSSVMKDHLPLILEQLCKNAEAVLQSSERDLSLKRSMKMLILTAQSLLCALPSQSNAATA